jgi:ribosomal protein L37E
MSWINCPLCGARNFTVAGWADLDRCSSCGQPLATPPTRELTDSGRVAAARSARTNPPPTATPGDRARS